MEFSIQISVHVSNPNFGASKTKKVHDDSSTGFDPEKCAKNAVLDALTLVFDT